MLYLPFVLCYFQGRCNWQSILIVSVLRFRASMPRGFLRSLRPRLHTSPSLGKKRLYSRSFADNLSRDQIQEPVFNQQIIYAINRATNFAPANVCDHLAPGRGQNDAYGEISSLWRRSATRGISYRTKESTRDDFGLDGIGTATRDFRQFDGASI